MTDGNKLPYFLNGGGKMGELIRQKDWEKTPLGNPVCWPQSLCTMVAVMLANNCAMYIAWGSHFIPLYNDAFSNIIESTETLDIEPRDPLHVFGPTIAPMLAKVMKGEAANLPSFTIPTNQNEPTEASCYTFSIGPIVKEDGAIGGVLITVAAIIQKKVVDEQLKKSEERFRTMVEGTDIMIAISDETNSSNYFNNAWTHLTGWSMVQLMEFKWADLIHDDDRQIFLDLYSTSFQKRLSYTCELRIKNKKGGYNWLFASGMPSFRPDGSFSGFIASFVDITERRYLAEEKQKLMAIIEASPEFIGMVDLHYQIKYANPAAMEMLGLDSYEGRKIIEWVSKENREFAKRIKHELIEKEIFTHEVHFRNEKTNVPFWIRLNAFTIKDPTSKKIIGFATVSPNITKRKKAEYELPASELRFRTLAEALPQLIWETNETGDLVYTSIKWKEYIGFEPKSNEDWKTIIHPLDFDLNLHIWQQSLQTGNTYRNDFRLKTKIGNYRWHTVIAESILDTNLKVTGWAGSLTDIHKEKSFTLELEKKVAVRTKELENLNMTLIKSEQRYHLMINEVQDYAIFYLNINGTVENWNKGAEKIKGYAAHEIIGNNFSIFYPEQDRLRKLPEKLLEQALETGRAVHEGWRVRKDKSTFWANVAITAVHDEVGKLIGFSKVTHDLTDKKEASNKLAIIAEQLEQKNEVLGNINNELNSFTYIASHDLQEPLRKIETFSARLLEKEAINLSEKGKEYLVRLQNSAKRMKALILDLLAYSQTAAIVDGFENMDLRKMTEEVRDELLYELEQKQGIITVGNMCKANIIPFQFRQLLHNIIGNSLKFSVPGQPLIIHIESIIKKNEPIISGIMAGKDSYCHIQISDNGIGFTPQDAEKIFGLFQRVHGNSGQYEGTGIGLAIVKKIVDNHNGVITALGKLDHGAIFDIYIPS